jgi:hemin uptake protein HemP
MTEFTHLSPLTVRATAKSASPYLSTGTPDTAATSRANAGSAAPLEQRVFRSDALLQGQNHVLIAHNGETYQLRATRLGKLILTK